MTIQEVVGQVVNSIANIFSKELTFRYVHVWYSHDTRALDVALCWPRIAYLYCQLHRSAFHSHFPRSKEYIIIISNVKPRLNIVYSHILPLLSIIIRNNCCTLTCYYLDNMLHISSLDILVCKYYQHNIFLLFEIWSNEWIWKEHVNKQADIDKFTRMEAT